MRSTPSAPEPPGLNARQLAALADALEAPDCDCDWQPGMDPCPHVLAAGHDVPVADWGRLLLLLRPDDYTEPPPPAPTLVMSREARIAVYEERASLGQTLFHTDDAARDPDPDAELHVAPVATRGRNGADRADQQVATVAFVGTRELERIARRAA